MASEHTAAAPAPHSVGRDIRRTLTARLAYLVSRVAMPPLVLSFITLDEYGLWSASFVVVSHLGLAASGLSAVYVRGAAQAHLAGDTAALSRLMSTGIALAALVGAALWALIAFLLPLLIDVLHVPPSLRPTAALLTLGACAVFVVDVSLGGLAYVLHGIGRVADEQKIWLQASLLECALGLAGLLAGLGVTALLLAFVGRYVFSITVTARAVHRLVPGLTLAWRHADWATLKRLRRFGLLVQTSSVIATVLQSADRVIAGLMLGPQAVAVFDLASKIPVTLGSLSGAVAVAAQPAAARTQHTDALAGLYRQSTRWVGLMLALPLPFLVCFAQPLCVAWLPRQSDPERLAPVLAAIALGSHWHLLTGPASALYRGAGRGGVEFVYHGARITALVAAVFGVWATGVVTLERLAWALNAGTIAAALAGLVFNHRQFVTSLHGFGRDILFPALIFYPLAATARSLLPDATDRPAAFGVLLIGAVAYTVLCAPVWWWGVLNGDERQAAWRRCRVART